MIRYAALVLLFVQTLDSVAQVEFCPAGAKWIYYTQGDGGPWFPEQRHISEYVADTLIQGFAAKKLETIRLGSPYLNSRYIRQQNDSIIIWNNNEWQLLFDLDVTAGETRYVYLEEGDNSLPPCLQNDTIRIDSVWYVEYQGLQLKTIGFTALINDWFGDEQAFSGVFTERIGFKSNHPLYQPINCDLFFLDLIYPPFVCYTDSLLDSTFPDTCDFTLSNETLELEVQPNIYMNNGTMQIQNAQNAFLKIYNILGEALFNASISSHREGIDIAGLPNGVLLVVLEKDGKRVTKKVVN